MNPSPQQPQHKRDPLLWFFYVAFIGLMISAAALTVGIVQSGAPTLADPPVAFADAPSSSRPVADTECDGKGEGGGCGPGHGCLNGRCTPLLTPLRSAGIGERCDGKARRCVPGLRCTDGRCELDADHELRRPECSAPEVQEAIQQLYQRCKDRPRDLRDLSRDGCSLSDWEELSMKSERFDLLASALPIYSVHFPEDWKSSEGMDLNILRELAPYRESLEQSKGLFVIGRLAPTKAVRSRAAYREGGDRMQFVSTALRRFFATSADPRSDEFVEKIKNWIVSGERPLTKDAFLRIFSNAIPIGDSQNTTKRLRRILGNKGLDKLQDGDWDFLEEQLARVVLIVEIPCRLSARELDRDSLPLSATP